MGDDSRAFMRSTLVLLVIVVASAHNPLLHSVDHSHDLAVEHRSGGRARIFCRRCGAEITVRAHYAEVVKTDGGNVVVIAEPEGGKHPVIRNFTNPQGVDMQVVNFIKGANIKVHGDPSFDSSFFPPYSWQIIGCSKCQAHLGWKFHNPKIEKSASMVCDGKMVTVPSTPLGEDPLSVLEGKCTVSRKGWWTYQWCHKKEIRQYHTENGVRSHDWSLGRFDSTGRKERPANRATKFKSHFFLDGQRCDETGKGRSSEVTFNCCADDNSDIAKQAREEGEEMYIRTIDE